MIILLLILLSISAIYVVRLLARKGLRCASIAIGVLYSVIVVWMYAIFIFDAASLGFNGSESWRSMLLGGDIYRSFVNLNEAMSVLPNTVLHAITYVSILILTLAFIVVFHGFFSVASEIISYVKTALYKNRKTPKLRGSLPTTVNIKIPVIRLFCRMNC